MKPARVREEPEIGTTGTTGRRLHYASYNYVKEWSGLVLVARFTH